LRFIDRGAPIFGPVAQWSEPAAHNGLVAGSSPARPTKGFYGEPAKTFADNRDFAATFGGSARRSANEAQSSIADAFI
jgi:hypothetical protein